MSDSIQAQPRSNGGRPHVSRYEPFLKAYFDPESPSCGNAAESARTVGISPRAGSFHIAKFRRLGPPEKMRHAFHEMGLDEWFWAAKIKQLCNATGEHGEPTSVTVEGTKMLGKALGVVIPDAVQVSQITQNISGGPVMIVVGASDQRFKQLESGALEGEVVTERSADGQDAAVQPAP